MKLTLRLSVPAFIRVLKLLNSIFVCALLFLSIACGSNGETVLSERSDLEEGVTGVNIGGDGDLFADEALVEVQINMADEDFAILRDEGRTLAETARQCIPEFEYSEFNASVNINGFDIEQVTIRKKGFLGSLSTSKPSIKLNFGKQLQGQTFQNMKRMTLNNNRQNPTNARQCLTYNLFRQAGLVAPRCNLARVTVNGELLGIYINVEPIKKPFLKHNYQDDDGNLYEAQIADFGTHLVDKFEKKTNEQENDRSDLQLVVDALNLPDTEFATQISQIVDVDEFIQF